MKYKRLLLRLSSDTLQRGLQRYHYEDKADLYYQVYEDVKRKIEPSIYYRYGYFGANESLFIFTLGHGPDELQERYQQEGNLDRSYAVTCLCLDFLTEGYRQIGEIIRRERREFLQEMIFDDSVEIEELFTLVPKQTVIFHAITGRTCRNDALHNCNKCQMKNCVYRKEVT